MPVESMLRNNGTSTTVGANCPEKERQNRQCEITGNGYASKSKVSFLHTPSKRTMNSQNRHRLSSREHVSLFHSLQQGLRQVPPGIKKHNYSKLNFLHFFVALLRQPTVTDEMLYKVYM